MKKKPSIEVVDARRVQDGLRVAAYRVKSVGKNGEVLQVSEVLNDVKAVRKHINAMLDCWGSFETNVITVTDKTKAQKFA